MRRLYRLGLILALGSALAGCNHSPTPSAGGSHTVGLDLGQQAPNIKGYDLDGRSFSLADYRGKVVVLDFWFST